MMDSFEKEIREGIENNIYDPNVTGYLGKMISDLFLDREERHRIVSAFMDFVFNVPGKQNLADYRNLVLSELKALEASHFRGYFNDLSLPIREIGNIVRNTPFSQSKPDDTEALAALLDLKRAITIPIDTFHDQDARFVLINRLMNFSEASENAVLKLKWKREKVMKTLHQLSSSEQRSKAKKNISGVKR